MSDSITIDQMRSLGWATERTLLEVAHSTKASSAVLKVLGEKFKIDREVLDRAMTGLSASIHDTTDAVDKNSKGITEDSKNRRKDITGLTSANRQFANGLGRNLRNLLDREDPKSFFSEFGRSLKEVGDNFRDANGKIGFFARAAQTAGISLTILAGMYGKISDTSDQMRKLYENGLLVTTGMSSLVQSSSDAGVRLSIFAEQLSRFGGVAVTLGTTNLLKMSTQFQRLTRFSSDLMMTQEEGNHAFLETLELMRVSGELQGRTQNQVAQRSVELLRSFNELSIASGRNRDEIRRQTAEIMRQPILALWSRMLPQEGRTRLANITAQLTAQFGEMASTLSDMIENVGQANGSFGLMDDRFRPLLAIVPGFGQALQSAADSVRTGSISQEEAVRRLSRSFSNVSNAQLQIIRQANPALAGFISQILLARQQVQDSEAELRREADARGMSIDQIVEERKVAEQRQAALLGTLNGARASLARLTQAFTRIAVSLSGFIMPVVDVFTMAINGVSTVLEGFAAIIEPISNLLSGLHRGISQFFSFVTGGRMGAGPGESGSNVASLITTVGLVLGSAAILPIITRLAGGLVRGSLTAVGGGLLSRGMMAAGGAAAGGLGRAAAGGAASRGAGIVAGLGRGGGSLLEGAATGLRAFAAPQVLLGATILAGSIAIIGAGIAGATWIMGKALPTLAEGMKAFTEIDGNALKNTGVGMMSLGAGLAALTVGSITAGLGSLISGLVGLFAEDPITKLRRFAELGQPLQIAATSINALADSLGRLTQLDLSGLRNLRALQSLPASIPTITSPAPVTTVRPNNTPTIATEDLAAKTISYYDNSTALFNQMVVLLNTVYAKLDEIKAIEARGFTTLNDTIVSNGRRI